MDKCHVIKVDKKNCVCRLWNKGLSSQCKSFKIKDKQYCKSHYEKTNNGKELWGFGLITDKGLPKNHLSDYPEKKGKSLPWKVEIKNFDDNEIVLNQLMPREIQKTNRKCSICGKPGHNKRKCPEINSYKGKTVPKKKETVPKKEETVPKKEETVPKKEETDIYMEPYMISYQGVSYIYSEKNGEKHIINSKTEIVGLWDKGGIQWNDKKYELEHNNSK